MLEYNFDKYQSWVILRFTKERWSTSLVLNYISGVFDLGSNLWYCTCDEDAPWWKIGGAHLHFGCGPIEMNIDLARRMVETVGS